MKDLLTRWHELAPEECAQEPPPVINGWCLAGDKIRIANWGTSETRTNQFLAGILYAVLMCCEKRGWDYELALCTGNTKPIQCLVIRFLSDTGEHHGYGASPAEAALRSYIKALEAEAKTTEQ